jgi:hypothetical protein
MRWELFNEVALWRRADPGPAADQEVPDVFALVHNHDARALVRSEAGPVNTWLTRSSRAVSLPLPSIAKPIVNPGERVVHAAWHADG